MIRISPLLIVVACACGDAAPGTGGPDSSAAETLPSDVADVAITPDAPAQELVDAVDTSPAEALGDTAADAPDAPDAPDPGLPLDVADGAPDIEPTTDAAAEVAPPVDPAACPVPSMKEVYPGPFPPIPYGAWARAEGCVAQPHDVVIVLGCPSESDGAPSKCQIDRARMAEQLYDAHWASHFIVSGAAVHNGHVEADALHALLVARGIPSDAIIREPKARHTDENIYYATRIMQAEGWDSALVVSEDPGHLMWSALCDSNCCVDLGRLTLFEWEVEPGLYIKAGHYALIPPGPANIETDCQHIAGMFLCVNLANREACKDDFQLPP